MNSDLLNALRKKAYVLPILVILLILLTACGTLEVGLEPPVEDPTRPPDNSEPSPTFEDPLYDTKVGVTFGSLVELVGYSVEPSNTTEIATASLVWILLADIQQSLTVVILGSDGEQTFLAQFDPTMSTDVVPKGIWPKGQEVVREYPLPINQGTAVEKLRLQVGLYDAATGELLDSDRSRNSDLPANLRDLGEVVASETVEPTAKSSPTPETVIADVSSGETADDTPLTVAYVKNENVWVWTETEGSIPLTSQGGVSGVRISDDGSIVVFWRSDNLWAVNSDGTDERNLTTQRDFANIDVGDEMAPYVKSIAPSQVEWRPNSHQLYFNTSPRIEGPGLFLNDDLWVIDLDDGLMQMILPPGEGGNFYFSPNGERVAVVTPGQIQLMDYDGNNRQDVLYHEPIITYSEFQYYATPVWSADSQSLVTAIPPVDFMAGEYQPTTIWRIDDSSQPARKIGDLMTSMRMSAPPAFDPDLGQVAYLFGEEATNGPGSPPAGLAIAALDQNTIGESVIYSQEVENLGDWSPSGRQFIFTPAGSVVGLRKIGEVGKEPVAIGDGQSPIVRINWVDENNYIFNQKNGLLWDLVIDGTAEQPARLIDSIEQMPPDFDVTGTRE